MNAQEAAQTLKDLGWIEQRIAAKVGCSQSTVNQIRNGKRVPLRPLADALVLLAKKEQRKRDKAHDSGIR